MRYLLDTNIFLWFLNGDQRIPDNFIEIISAQGNSINISIVSIWEIIIKESLGKLKLKTDIFDYINQNEIENNITILTLEKKHLKELKYLPLIHRDPFDRLIYAQAVNEKILFLYTDKIFDEYNRGRQ